MPRRSSYPRSRSRRSGQDRALAALIVLIVTVVAALVLSIIQWISAAGSPDERRQRVLIVATILGAGAGIYGLNTGNIFFAFTGIAVAVWAACWLGYEYWINHNPRVLTPLQSATRSSTNQHPSSPAGSMSSTPVGPSTAATPAAIDAMCRPLADAAAVWYIEPKDPPIWLVPIGPYYLDARLRCRVDYKPVRGLTNDVPVWGIHAGGWHMYFLPNTVVIDIKGRAQEFAYGTLQIEVIRNLFGERDRIPRDTTIVDKTWEYVTVKGLPDLRYRSNPEIPVAEYGVIHLKVPNSRDIYLQVSTLWAATKFVDKWSQVVQAAAQGSQQQALAGSSAGLKTVPISSSAAPAAPAPMQIAFVSPLQTKVLVCCDQRTGEGCRAIEPLGSAQCTRCGRPLRFALVVHAPGVVLGHYSIDRLIGSGSYGAVYVASDLDASGRKVALKETFDSTSIVSFTREFAVMSTLSHPHLPRYYEMFEDGGTGYLSMEFVDGQSLEDVLRTQGGPLVESQVLAYALQCCDALQFLHSQNPVILHRDIKPANIRITPSGLIKLVDFGLHKQGVGQTQTVNRALSPVYAPLEQYSGGTDQRSDVYSLGATLYHLLSGHEPPAATDRVSRSPDPLVPLVQINRQVSRHVDSAIMQAMALHQNDRFLNVVTMRRALLQSDDTLLP